MSQSSEQSNRTTMMGLRDLLYSKERMEEALDGYRPQIDSLEDADPELVLGVIAEISLLDPPDLIVIVAGFANGDARLLWSTGGGILGNLYEYPNIATAAKAFVEAAQPLVSSLRVETEHPLPGPNRIRYAILTPGGVHPTEQAGEVLENPRHAVHKLYVAMNNLMGQLLQLNESFKKES